MHYNSGYLVDLENLSDLAATISPSTGRIDR